LVCDRDLKVTEDVMFYGEGISYMKSRLGGKEGKLSPFEFEVVVVITIV